MRMIVEEKTPSLWMAYWADAPETVSSESGSVLGAVAKLLILSPGRNVAVGNLQWDEKACRKGWVELVVVGAECET